MTYDKEIYYGLFNDSFPPIIDGVTLTVVNYASHLSLHGRAPLVVTPRNPVRYDTPYPQIRYFSLPIWNRHPYRYGYPKLDFSIRRRLMAKRFRICHSHSPFSAGRLAVYVAREQRVPLIGTFHSKYRTDLEHSFRRAPWMTAIIMRRIRNFFAACDEIWIPQADVEATVREYGITGKVSVMENGNDFVDRVKGNLHDFKKAARGKLGIPQGTLALLFVGQHIWEKGIGVIADTLARLDGKIDFRMDFIGDGYASELLKKKIRTLGLEGKACVHGPIRDRDELADFYAAADIFLFPSFYDNAPLVVREAAAMGCPSILLKGSTASEVIDDRKNGFLTGNSPDDYAALILQLVRSPGLVREAGENARKTLVRGWDDVIEEVEERYDRIISNYNPK